MSIIIRPAQQPDVVQITELVNRFASKNIMLPRSEANVHQTLADWLVAIEIDELSEHTLVTNDRAGIHEIDTETGDGQVKYIHDAALNQLSTRVVGCGALVPLSDKLVEIRSLAIDESQHGKGLGSALVLHLVDLAREREFAQVCALTLRPNFFTRLGFMLVDRWSISPKVWQACIYCPKFHRCDEVAVLTNLDVPETYLIRKDSQTDQEQNRLPGWNRLLRWGEWQPLRLAYQYQDKDKDKEKKP